MFKRNTVREKVSLFRFTCEKVSDCQTLSTLEGSGSLSFSVTN